MRRHAKAFVAIFASLLSTLAIAGPAVAAPPTATIDAPSAISYTSAHVSGTVNPNGGPAGIYASFEFRQPGDEFWVPGPGARLIEGAEAEGTDPIPVEDDLTGLKAGTEYEVRLNAYSEGPHYSAEQNFTTDAIPAPSVSINPPDSVAGTTAHFSGTIDPEAPVGNPAASDVQWRFECTPECPGLAGTIAADSSPHTVSADAAGLLPNTDYEVRLVAENAGDPVSDGPELFTTHTVSPVADTLFAGGVTESQAILRGRVNPQNSAVTYQFEWGTTSAYGNVAPATPASLGFQDASAHAVSVPISGLAAGTTYHFRIVATNSESSSVKHGDDLVFTTSSLSPPASPCANDLFRTAFGAFLPDCRAYEQVTPVDKAGLEPVMSDGIISNNFLVLQAGNEVQYLVPGAFGDAISSLQFTGYRSNRESGEWETHGLGPVVKAAPKYQQTSILVYSRDYSHAVVVSYAALAPGAVAGQHNIYLEDTRTGALDLIITTTKAPNMQEFAGPAWVGGTPDFSHILFIEEQALTPDAPDNGRTKLYEYSDGEVRLVSYGPDDQPSTEYVPFGPDLNNTISADGSRIIYPLSISTSLEYAEGLYERVDGHTEPAAVSQRTGEEGQVEGGAARYVSPDGSFAYISTLQPLTDESGDRTSIGGSWLYREEDGVLDEITPPGGLRDAWRFAFSADAKRVYFQEKSALYTWHDGVRTLLGEGLEPSSPVGIGISRGGRYAAISTKVPLTGYENQNPTKCAASPEGGRCSQIYLFDSVTKELKCVSCRTDGGPPTGPSNFGSAPSEFNTAAQNSVVTETGTVYFNTTDPLVDTDVNGRADVYQYRDGVRTLMSTGTSTRDSLLGGVSPDGRDVYFATDAQLVPQDRDLLLDIYDARVDGGLPSQYSPESPVPCDGEACKGPISNPPDGGSPGTASFVGKQGSPRVVSSRCRGLAGKARAATRKAKAKAPGKQRRKAMKKAAGLRKQASKCRAGGAR